MAEKRIALKRVYAEPSQGDGRRILVDRLWPRGLTKEKAKVDLWLKEIAPTQQLRKWFGHDTQKWSEFQSRYQEELKSNPEALDILRQEAKEGPITLLYAARDEEHNEAVVLQRLLEPGTSRDHPRTKRRRNFPSGR